jgi:hypothetical protein
MVFVTTWGIWPPCKRRVEGISARYILGRISVKAASGRAVDLKAE